MGRIFISHSSRDNEEAKSRVLSESISGPTRHSSLKAIATLSAIEVHLQKWTDPPRFCCSCF
jgi:hypothetical protein